MIGIYVGVGLTALICVGVCAMICCMCEEKRTKIIGCIVTAVLAILLCGGLLWYLYGTEAGKRAIKSFDSNVSGGIERTVTVYDVESDVIVTYSGKFDVEYDSERILFDDENGKRHVIYYRTGTVIIDEK